MLFQCFLRYPGMEHQPEDMQMHMLVEQRAPYDFVAGDLQDQVVKMGTARAKRE